LWHGFIIINSDIIMTTHSSWFSLIVSRALGITLLMLTFFFTSCKKSDSDSPSAFMADVSRPTWTAITDYDMPSSMNIIAAVDLKQQFPSLAADWQLTDNDLLAAFIGDQCCEVAKPHNSLFYLYITLPMSQISENKITLRYWSAYYKNVFTGAETIYFVNDDILGTIDEPYQVPFAEP